MASPDHDPNHLTRDAEDVRSALQRACSGLVDREPVAEVVVLCAVAGEHLLVIGPPGTAKSEAVRRIASQLGGTYFEYLLGRFTEPSEIFGPVDLRRLRDGVVEIETAGMLPEADVAFLDEVFLGSTAILNTLLTILNERRFRRGTTELTCPLRVCVGASNVLPDDPALAAFADRFLARLFVDPVPDGRLEDLLEAGDRPQVPAATPALGAVARLTDAARSADLSAVRPHLADAIRRLRSAGMEISDRRGVRVQRLIAAAAVLDGRASAAPKDLWVLPMIAPTVDAQQTARDALGDLIADASSQTLVYSAEALAASVAARAQRLVASGEALLGLDRDEHSQLRIEALLREIDSGFAEQDRPAELTVTRQRLIAERST